MTYILVSAIFFVGGIAFYKHRQYIKLKAAAEFHGVYDMLKQHVADKKRCL